jgi:hypothetical protein
MDQVFWPAVECGVDHFSPSSSVDWTGLWQTVQSVLQSAPAREEHCRLAKADRKRNVIVCRDSAECVSNVREAWKVDLENVGR